MRQSMTISNYSTTPSDNDDPAPNGAPEGISPSAVNNIMRQGMADHRAQWNDAEWFEYLDGDKTGVASYVSSNVFKVTGTDATSHYHVGRRVKVVGGSGTVYGTITTVSYSGGATNVTIDQTLTNEAITVYTAIISAVNSSLPPEAVQDIVGGMLTGNTTTNITVTYQDSDGTIDFVATSQTENDFTTVLKNKLDGIATSANNYIHPTGEGYKHIPSGGVSGQYLSWSSAGTAAWSSPPWALSSHNHSGVYKPNFTTTVSTASPSGGANGDVWYKY